MGLYLPSSMQFQYSCKFLVSLSPPLNRLRISYQIAIAGGMGSSIGHFEMKGFFSTQSIDV